YVGFVQWRINFVQQAEGRRTIMEDSQHERKRSHSLLAARKQQHVLKTFARRLSYDVYAGFKHVVGFNQGHLAATAAEQFLKERAEVSINLLKSMTETLARAPLDFAQSLFRRGYAVEYV